MKLTLEKAKAMMDRNNGNLDLRGTEITNPTVKRLRHGEYVSGKYLYANGILTHIKAGTESFVNSLKDLKDKYTVREVIEMTEGQYGAEQFRAFFKGDCNE